jgi:Uma2 family endonuclease
MLPLLEQPAIRKRAHSMSVEAYHVLGEMGMLSEQVELLNGVIVDKMPRSPLHILICRRLVEMLRALLLQGFDCRQEQPLTFLRSEPEPDIAVVRGSFEDFGNGHPTTAELIIEVSVSTEASDRAKAEIYAEAGVKEYWIVLPEQRRIEVFQNPVGAIYTQHTVSEAGATVTSAVLDRFSVNLNELFAEAKA